MAGMNIAVLGARGWLGSQILKYFSASALEADIRDASAVQGELERVGPDIVINCAGITGKPNIAWCQANAENMIVTTEVNGVAPATVGRLCAAAHIRLVHLSSASVFETTPAVQGGLTEAVIPSLTERMSLYGLSKRAGEIVLQPYGALVLRIHMPFSSLLHGRNLYTRMAGYPQVDDVVNTITAVPDMLKSLECLLAAGTTGIVHVVNPEPINSIRIMELYQEHCDPAHHFTVRKNGPATRPGVVLATARLREMGIVMGSTELMLVQSMKRYGKL